MTVQEAIDLLENLDGMIEDNHNSDYDSAFKIAIGSMKEVEQCRALGTVEELKEAREKQVAKKPRLEGEFFKFAHCPSCDNLIQFKQKYCPECGSKIDWEKGAE